MGGASYPSAVVQSAYSAAPADRVKREFRVRKRWKVVRLKDRAINVRLDTSCDDQLVR